MFEKTYYVPPEIVALRKKLVDDFMSGNSDDEVLRKLRDFAEKVRGRPRTEVAPRKRQLRSYRPAALDDGRRTNAGRQKGSRFLIVNGRRKLVPMMEIDNAIRNGARYPDRIPAESRGAADDQGSALRAGEGVGAHDCVSYPVAELRPAEG